MIIIGEGANRLGSFWNGIFKFVFYGFTIGRFGFGVLVEQRTADRAMWRAMRHERRRQMKLAARAGRGVDGDAA